MRRSAYHLKRPVPLSTDPTDLTDGIQQLGDRTWEMGQEGLFDMA